MKRFPDLVTTRLRGCRGLSRGLPVLLLGLALAPLGACAPTDLQAAIPDRLPKVLGQGFPLTVSFANGDRFEIPGPPRRILPANAGTVDFLRLLVPPEHVVALPETTDGFSSLAQGAADGAVSWADLPRFRAYAGEPVLALEPDLVLTHTWQTPETSALLRRAGLCVLSLPTPRSWEEVLETLELYGRVLGAQERAERVAGQLAERVRDLARRAREHETLRAMSYANFGAGGTTAGSGTTLDVVFQLAGLVNAAQEAGIDGYVSLDHERLLSIDPDLLVVDAAGDSEGNPGAGPQAKRYLLSQPELASLRAVRGDGIVVLPSELFTTVSTELVRAAEELQRALGWR